MHFTEACCKGKHTGMAMMSYINTGVCVFLWPHCALIKVFTQVGSPRGIELKTEMQLHMKLDFSLEDARQSLNRNEI